MLFVVVKVRCKEFIFTCSWSDSHALVSAHITVANGFIGSFSVFVLRLMNRKGDCFVFEKNFQVFDIKF